MIVYDLVCDAAHRFEAWFGSSADYDAQAARGLISCPICGSGQVGKAVMAPALPTKSNQTSSSMMADPAARLLALQRALEAESQYVGPRLAEEARAIQAEGAARIVHGEASPDEVKALREEGIALMPLPFRPLAGSDA